MLSFGEWFSDSSLFLLRPTLIVSAAQLEIHVRSPSVKIHRAANYDIRSLPVFGDHDKVAGQVLLDVSLCATPGRLTIFVRTHP